MRLTKKELMSAINQPMCFGSRLVGKKMFAQIIKELCEYKDIEEELGVDLITFIRIYKAKKFFLKDKDYYWKIHHRCDKGIVVGTNKLIYLPFKFYGKTWALTKEELL